MGLIDKFKNMFTEEVEEEEVVETEPIEKPKKVVSEEIKSRQVEYQHQATPTRKTPTRISPNLGGNIDDIIVKKYTPEEPIVRHEEKIKPEVQENKVLKREEKFVFPVYFDDKDFEKIEEKPKKVEEKKKPEKKELYGAKIEKKETPKVFKPTPIISPIYGILDKNYHKEDISTKKVSHSEYRDPSKPLTIDEVRRKAYGKLEDDLEMSLFTQSSIFMEPDTDKESKEESKNNLLTDLVDNNSDKEIYAENNEDDSSMIEKTMMDYDEDDDKEYDSVDEFLNSSIDEYNAKHKPIETDYEEDDDFDLDDTLVNKKIHKGKISDDIDLDATLVNKKSFRSKDDDFNLDDTIVTKKPTKSKAKDQDADLDNLLEDYIMNNNDENEKNKNVDRDEEDEDLTQSDLFNLIDSMYEKGEDE